MANIIQEIISLTSIVAKVFKCNAIMDHVSIFMSEQHKFLPRRSCIAITQLLIATEMWTGALQHEIPVNVNILILKKLLIWRPMLDFLLN